MGSISSVSRSSEALTDVLEAQDSRHVLRFLTCGSVDDGKSSLIGRLLFDSQKVLEDQLDILARDSKKSGTQGDRLDLALLVDGLQSEREQGITIDVAYRYFATDKRRFIIADTPGHEQYTRNMVTGASTCDLAIILIDATKGVQQQTRRHSYLCSLLGIKQIIVAINKMDLVDYSQERYKQIQHDFLDFSGVLNLPDIRFVPISALEGDNVVHRSEHLAWFRGSTLLEYLETSTVLTQTDQDFRFPVQRVCRPSSDFRGYQGSIVSGEVSVGDTIRVLPSGQISTIKAIVTMGGDKANAHAPDAITLTLHDDLDVSRGNVIVHKDALPKVARRFRANLVWMQQDSAMQEGKRYAFKFATQEVVGWVEQFKHRVDIHSLQEVPARELHVNDIGLADISLVDSVIFDAYVTNRHMGSFIVIDLESSQTVAAGMIEGALAAAPVYWHKPSVSKAERIERNQHRACVLWFTGLSGAGKSTIANALNRALFEQGVQGYVLDGDNLRHGLSSDLGFSAEDRAENIRRAAEMAKILADAGMVVSAAFISPLAEHRLIAKRILADAFIEVFVDVPLDECARRDPKGLYARSKKGDIQNFTGLSAPFETPLSPAIHLKANENSVEECVAQLIAYMRAEKMLK